MLFTLANAHASNMTDSRNTTFNIFSLLLVLYVFVIRPHFRYKKKRHSIASKLKEGVMVHLNGGIKGKVTAIKIRTIIVNTGNNSEIEVYKTGIYDIIDEEKEAQIDAEFEAMNKNNH